MIEIKQVTKRYGKARGIKDVTLSIEKGEVFGFIGPNGAGKSTTIKCLMGMLRKKEGSIKIGEQEIELGSYKMKEDIGYLPSEIHLYDDMTVEKMLKYSVSFYQKNCSARIEELVKRLEVDTKKKIDELSLGNLKKIGIIVALMHEPSILILDEATSGLDPLMQETFYEILKEEKSRGTTIFFSSHNLNEVKRICDRVGIIKEGKLIKVSTIEEISHTSFVNVMIESSQVKEIIKKIPEITILQEEKTKVKLIYQQEMNCLLQILKEYKIDKLLIEEPSIEEIFMHYYQ